MEIELNVTTKFDVKYLQVNAGVRYWKDATVNDVVDEQGDLIPCRDGDYWKPLIELETGKILNWKEGVNADINYIVCDNGVYQLLGNDHAPIVNYDGYAPKCLSIGDNGWDNGYGDYIIMKVDENGMIQNWPEKVDLLDSLIASLEIPMPPQFRLEKLKNILPEKIKAIKEYVITEIGEIP